MSSPGWYPDPSGRGQRYWDGSAWTSQTRPATPPPAGAANDIYVDEKGSRRNLWIGLLVGGLTLLVVAGLLIDVLTRKPAPPPFSASPPVSTPSPPTPSSPTPRTPSATPSSKSPTPSTASPSTPRTPSSPSSKPPGQLADCKGADNHSGTSAQTPGWATGGRLAYRLEAEFGPRLSQDTAWFPFVSDFSGQKRRAAGAWVNPVAVGYVTKTDFGDNLADASERALACFASVGYPGKVSDTVVADEATTVSGRPAYHRAREIRVAGQSVAGDRDDVILVDTGDPERWSVMLTCIELKPDILALGEQMRASLKVV